MAGAARSERLRDFLFFFSFFFQHPLVGMPGTSSGHRVRWRRDQLDPEKKGDLAKTVVGEEEARCTEMGTSTPEAMYCTCSLCPSTSCSVAASGNLGGCFALRGKHCSYPRPTRAGAGRALWLDQLPKGALAAIVPMCAEVSLLGLRACMQGIPLGYLHRMAELQIWVVRAPIR